MKYTLKHSCGRIWKVIDLKGNIKDILRCPYCKTTEGFVVESEI